MTTPGDPRLRHGDRRRGRDHGRRAPPRPRAARRDHRLGQPRRAAHHRQHPAGPRPHRPRRRAGARGTQRAVPAPRVTAAERARRPAEHPRPPRTGERGPVRGRRGLAGRDPARGAGAGDAGAHRAAHQHRGGDRGRARHRRRGAPGGRARRHPPCSPECARSSSATSGATPRRRRTSWRRASTTSPSWAWTPPSPPPSTRPTRTGSPRWAPPPARLPGASSASGSSLYGGESAPLHDPLAVALLLDEGVVRTEPASVTVELEPRTDVRPDGVRARGGAPDGAGGAGRRSEPLPHLPLRALARQP